MHLKDNMLRALLDEELPDDEIEKAQMHLAQCPACRSRLARLNQQARQVNASLAVMAPTAKEQPGSSQIAYQRLIHNPPQDYSNKETSKIMFKKRPLLVTLAVIAILAVVFTVTPANAWASSFLGLFRVQKVQVITFNPAMAENAQGKLDENQTAIKQIFNDNMQISSHGESVAVASAGEAAQKAGFMPRIPGAIAAPEISVRPGMNAVFTIDQPKLQALMDAVGVNAKLPASTNGKTITADIADAVVVTSGECPAAASNTEAQATPDCTILVQLPSPVVNAPDNLNVQQLGQAMFQFLGMSAADAEKLSQHIDWTSTLILPIPQSSQIQYQDVQVDGVTGTFFEEVGQNSYDLIWVKDGMLYGLHGPGELADAQKIAGSLR